MSLQMLVLIYHDMVWMKQLLFAITTLGMQRNAYDCRVDYISDEAHFHSSGWILIDNAELAKYFVLDAVLTWFYLLNLAGKDYCLKKHSQRRAGRRYIICQMEMEQK